MNSNYMKRQRGRGRKPGNNSGGGGSGGGGGGNRSFESTGPDVKIRGPASHIYEKYVQLARDANSSGDRVLAENFLQHAEHYFRTMRAAMPRERFEEYDQRTGVEQTSGSDEESAEGENSEASGEGEGQSENERADARFEGRGDRGDRPERSERQDYQREPRRDRGDRNDRGDRPRYEPRGERNDRGDRPDRNEQRADRPERGERGDRPERTEQRADRPERSDRPERVDRPERAERSERPERRPSQPQPFEGQAPAFLTAAVPLPIASTPDDDEVEAPELVEAVAPRRRRARPLRRPAEDAAVETDSDTDEPIKEAG